MWRGRRTKLEKIERSQEEACAMLAYLFWHRPHLGDPAEHYERRLLEFHQTLRGVVVTTASFRVRELPFASGPGYEDWYLAEDWQALGALNDAAVDRVRGEAHALVAGLSDAGWGACT